jgi:hypothetical protein
MHRQKSRFLARSLLVRSTIFVFLGAVLGTVWGYWRRQFGGGLGDGRGIFYILTHERFHTIFRVTTH